MCLLFKSCDYDRGKKIIRINQLKRISVQNYMVFCEMWAHFGINWMEWSCPQHDDRRGERAYNGKNTKNCYFHCISLSNKLDLKQRVFFFLYFSLLFSSISRMSKVCRQIWTGVLVSFNAIDKRFEYHATCYFASTTKQRFFFLYYSLTVFNEVQRTQCYNCAFSL